MWFGKVWKSSKNHKKQQGKRLDIPNTPVTKHTTATKTTTNTTDTPNNTISSKSLGEISDLTLTQRRETVIGIVESSSSSSSLNGEPKETSKEPVVATTPTTCSTVAPPVTPPVTTEDTVQRVAIEVKKVMEEYHQQFAQQQQIQQLQEAEAQQQQQQQQQQQDDDDDDPMDRKQVRLDGLEVYAVVSAVSAGTIVSIFDNHDPGDLLQDWQDGFYLKIITNFTFVIAGTIGIVCSMHCIFVFSLITMYGRTALGMDRDSALEHFFALTGIQRIRGFKSFVWSLYALMIELVIIISSKISFNPYMHISALIGTILLMYYVYKDTQVIMDKAAVIFAPPSSSSKPILPINNTIVGTEQPDNYVPQEIEIGLDEIAEETEQDTTQRIEDDDVNNNPISTNKPVTTTVNPLRTLALLSSFTNNNNHHKVDALGPRQHFALSQQQQQQQRPKMYSSSRTTSTTTSSADQQQRPMYSRSSTRRGGGSGGRAGAGNHFSTYLERSSSFRKIKSSLSLPAYAFVKQPEQPS